MRSKPPLSNQSDTPVCGKLYIVATPIGNKDDITLRALTTLKKVDLVAAEDTRKSGRLLAEHRIKTKLISYHDHNERERSATLIKKIEAGLSVALISSAGTPTVSDPGYHLVKEAIAQGIAVVPIPGVSAAAAALSVAGLSTDAFIFFGFLSKKKGKRLQQIKELAKEPRTIIIYESPRRVLELLATIQEIMGDRQAVLCREMTKINEEFLRGALSDILTKIRARDTVKGECTLLIAGNAKKTRAPLEMIAQEIQKQLAQKAGSVSSLSKEMAKKYGRPKSEIYKAALALTERKKN